MGAGQVTATEWEVVPDAATDWDVVTPKVSARTDEWEVVLGQSVAKPAKPLPYRILDTLAEGATELSAGVGAPAQIVRSLITGKPASGPPITGDDITGIRQESPISLDISPLATTILNPKASLNAAAEIVTDPLMIGGMIPGSIRKGAGMIGRTIAKEPIVPVPEVPVTPPPVVGPPPAAPPVQAVEPPIIPTQLTEQAVTPQAMKEVTVEAGKQATESLIQREASEPSKRLYKHVMESWEAGEFDAPSIQGVLQRNNMSLPEFIQEASKTVSTAGRQLKLFSDLRKQLNKTVMSESASPAEREAAASALASIERDMPAMPDTFWTRFKDVYNAVDNVRRASLTAQVATAMRNIESQTMRYGTDVLDQALQGTIKGEGIQSGTELAASFFRTMKPGQAKEIQKVLDAFPIDGDRLLQTPVGEVSLGNKYARLINTMNQAQESFFRRALFDGHLRAELGKRGIDAEQALANPASIPEDAFNTSVDLALKGTFAASPKPGTFGRAILDTYRAVPMLSTINPFPRFLANSYEFLTNYNPLGVVRMMGRDAEGKLLAANPEKRAEILSQALVGTGMLASAAAARELAGGEKWYQLKFGDQVVDTRAFAPFSTYLFMAEVSRIVGEVGLDVVKDGRTLQQALIKHGNMSTGDIVQGMLSINRIAGTGLVALDLMKAGSFDRKMDLMRDFFAQYVGGFTVPARTFKDMFAGVDKEEAKLRDTRESLTAPAVSNIPGLSQTLPESPSPVRAETPMTEHPILRQLTGLSVSTAKPIEQEMARLGIDLNQVSQRTGLPEVDRELSRRMGTMVEQGGLVELLQSPAYTRLDVPTQRLILRSQFGTIRQEAFAKLKQERPDLAGQLRIHQMPSTITDIAIDRSLLQGR